MRFIETRFNLHWQALHIGLQAKIDYQTTSNNAPKSAKLRPNFEFFNNIRQRGWSGFDS
jgi:hypothetical protein